MSGLKFHLMHLFMREGSFPFNSLCTKKCTWSMLGRRYNVVMYLWKKKIQTNLICYDNVQHWHEEPPEHTLDCIGHLDLCYPSLCGESFDRTRISSMKNAPSVRAFATFETASPTAEAKSEGRSDNLGMCVLGITSVCPALKGKISMQLYQGNA